MEYDDRIVGEDLDKPLDVCHECGSHLPHVYDALEIRDQMIQSLREDVANLEDDLRGKRQNVSRLRADRLARLRNADEYEAACRVLDHWQAILAPTAREPYSEVRLEKVIARLRGGYSKVDLMRAVDGYALKPYVVNGRRSATGTRDDWHADAELIFRNAKNVDNGIRWIEAHEEVKAMTGPQPAQKAPTVPSSGHVAEGLLRYPQTLGWHIFPIVPNGKNPATPNGFKNATQDPEKIVYTWTKRPDFNVAVRCGEPSGIVVIDFDEYKAPDVLHDLEKEFGELPNTLTAKTPGGGTHYFFRHPGVHIGPSVDWQERTGMDVRGDGSYVLIAPSTIDGRPYEWDNRTTPVPMPEWLKDALISQQERERDPKYYADVAKGVDAGSRNNKLFSWVCSLIARGVDEDAVQASAHGINRNFRPPLPEREVAGILNSAISRYGVRRAA